MTEVVNQRFTNKVVLVTGAGSGIGRAIAIQFAKEGANLLLAGKTPRKLKETQQIITEQIKECRVMYYSGNLGLEAVNKELVELALSHFGRLDIAINNASSYIFSKLTEISETELTTMIESNIKSVIYGTKYQLPAIGKTATPNNLGTIIYIGSLVGNRPQPLGGVYAATKGFVDTLTLAAAREGVEFHVRVNAVNPGPILTDETYSHVSGGDDTVRDSSSKSSLIKEPVEAAEIASFVADVASNSLLNGSRLLIDGGMSVLK